MKLVIIAGEVSGDIHAARLIFHSPLSFVLFDTGTYLTCPWEDSERYVKPYGALGEYLHEYRRHSDHWMSSRKGFFDLGDVAALLDPSVTHWEQVECPEVNWYMDYEFKGTLGSILRCYDIDRERTFALLFEKLKTHFKPLEKS